ncbi:MAG TPA: hypothetical protein VFU69_15860 [Ktedonobacterales bacterium]|nr:hypothetical protein [Ktedonobacterales bacterium]
MNRIASVLVMHSRDRVSWFVIPASVLGAGFAIVLVMALLILLLLGSGTPVYTGAVAAFYFVMLIEGFGAVTGTFPFAVGFGARRRDFVLGTLAMAAAVSAAWAILLGLLSLIEASVLPNWGVGLHFFRLPFFSDGSLLRQFCWSYHDDMACAQANPTYFNHDLSLQQFWVYFAFLLFMSLLGVFLGSIYQRFGRFGMYTCAGIAFLLLSVFVLLSVSGNWWGAIFGWLAQQTAAALGLWLLPLMALCALASYALLRKATV